ncbi:MAG: methyltransferase domain-containing protein [Magnetococcales bacterium]|nr:methyltransferase domain-containing protein [Magnetococcales bacterium]
MTFEAIRLQTWYATPLGQETSRLLGDAMAGWLGERKVERTFGFGYTQPYLDRMQYWTEGLVGASPAEMGVAPWPRFGENRIALVRPDTLPFADESFDRVVMIHLLEGSHSAKVTLRESWRILRPGGRLLVVTPNRGGFWARRDVTPFGWGRPFSPRQLQELLQGGFFLLRQSRYALFLPPLSGERWIKAASAWERAGERWFAPLGGVILCEAEKVVYATTPLTSSSSALGRRSMPMTVTENRAGNRIKRSKH